MLLEGKKVFVGPFLKRTERPADKELTYTNVFVKNLADTVTEAKLAEIFGEYGTVRAATSSNRLVAYICACQLPVGRLFSLGQLAQ